MGQSVVITSGKGGVGKTTATANLGVGLALLGRRVAMVDADIGLRNLDVVMGLEDRIVYDLVDVADGFCGLRQALVRDRRFPELYLLPAAQTKDKTAVTPEQMRALSAALKREFDYVLIDSPAGIEQGFRNAVAGADRAVIVTTPEVAAVRDADRIIGLLEASQLPAPMLVLNRVRPAMVRRGDMMDIQDVVDLLAIELLGVVPEDEAVITSTNRGEPVACAQGSRAGAAFLLLARRLDGQDVREAQGGFVGRLKRLVGWDH